VCKVTKTGVKFLGREQITEWLDMDGASWVRDLPRAALGGALLKTLRDHGEIPESINADVLNAKITQ
jgi:uroporphyrinogen-III synthase